MTQHTPQTATPRPEPDLAGVRNFRDVGGLPAVDGRRLHHGRLYRSGHLAHATKDDASFLASLGLHTIFDFRNATDIALEGPDVDLPGVRNVNMPLSDPAAGADFWATVRDGDLAALRSALGDGKGTARMVAAYRALIRERTAEHGRLLRLLAEEESVPVLLHCAAGKDRAGTSIAVILLALGVDREAIEADYLLSNDAHRRYRIKRGADADPIAVPEVMELLSPLFEARTEYLAAAFATIDELWGSTDHYLTEGLGLTARHRERLHALLLEDGEG
ncbi:tyrosine-protein phosphatase [Streptomyces sp. RB6PN25]|uniref:Tyrosine-protein phosphatase n=1 Tax=Streptomyces humicola TaxID=2953240 RepID=A0ABT1PXL5_9ACTN|nr:tyrosine-protein phosphatase [Streptomyces humicola]MCQ4082423.1 tyrosine-protein phosphatase [Streptomyces humicola]